LGAVGISKRIRPVPVRPSRAPIAAALNGKEGAGAVGEAGDHPVHPGIGLGARPCGRIVAHDMGVADDGGEDRTIRIPPFAQDQSFGLEHHRTISSSL
jgi:hypothetical protein